MSHLENDVGHLMTDIGHKNDEFTPTCFPGLLYKDLTVHVYEMMSDPRH